MAQASARRRTTLALVSATVALAALLAAAPASAVAAGELFSFGANRYGELGRTTNSGTEKATPTPAAVSLPGATGAVTAVAAGGAFSLAVTATGQLYGFGENYIGQLGTTTNNGVLVEVEFPVPNPTPAQVTLPGATGPVVEVAAGGAHSLALTSTGQLYGFGSNAYGQLGKAANSGTASANPTPTLVTLPGATGPVAQVAAGQFHSLALTSTGQLYAFGNNFSGQLGKAGNLNTNTPNPTPSLVSLPGATGPVVKIAAGADYSLALTSTGQLYAFGGNASGQLGTGTSTAGPTPITVSLPGATGPVVEIGAGASHTLAVTSTGQLYTFGSNNRGQLGRAANSGTGLPNPTPATVSLPGATGPVIAAGGGVDHSLALTSTGQLYAFGNNRFGELGTTTSNGSEKPNPVPVAVPVPVTAGVGVVALAAGPISQHSLALTADLPAPPGPGTQRRPVLSRLSLAQTKLSLAGRRVGADCVPQTAANSDDPPCRRRLRLRLHLKLDAAAKLTLSLTRLSAGRLQRGRCKKPTDANRELPRCSRSTRVGKPTTKQAGPGSDTLTLTGPALRPGRYRLTVRPANTAGKGTAKATTFRIVS